jgi:hypothetical protein
MDELCLTSGFLFPIKGDEHTTDADAEVASTPEISTEDTQKE